MPEKVICIDFTLLSQQLRLCTLGRHTPYRDADSDVSCDSVLEVPDLTGNIGVYARESWLHGVSGNSGREEHSLCGWTLVPRVPLESLKLRSFPSWREGPDGTNGYVTKGTR